jgi:hypothetical protein
MKSRYLLRDWQKLTLHDDAEAAGHNDLLNTSLECCFKDVEGAILCALNQACSKLTCMDDGSEPHLQGVCGICSPGEGGCDMDDGMNIYRY